VNFEDLIDEIVTLINDLRGIPEQEELTAGQQVAQIWGGTQDVATSAVLISSADEITGEQVKRMITELARGVWDNVNPQFAPRSPDPQEQRVDTEIARGELWVDLERDIARNVLEGLENPLGGGLGSSYANSRPTELLRESVIASRNKAAQLISYPDFVFDQDWVDLAAKVALSQGEIEQSEFDAIINRRASNVEEAQNITAWIARVEEKLPAIKNAVTIESGGRRANAFDEYVRVVRRETDEDVLKGTSLLPSYGESTVQNRQEKLHEELSLAFFSAKDTDSAFKKAVELGINRGGVTFSSGGAATRADERFTGDQVWEQYREARDAIVAELTAERNRLKSEGFSEEQIAGHLAGLLTGMMEPQYSYELGRSVTGFEDTLLAVQASDMAARLGDLPEAEKTAKNILQSTRDNLDNPWLREQLTDEDWEELVDVVFTRGEEAGREHAMQSTYNWTLNKNREEAAEFNDLDGDTAIENFVNDQLAPIGREWADLPDSLKDQFLTNGRIAGKDGVFNILEDLTIDMIDRKKEEEEFAQNLRQIANPGSPEFQRVVGERLMEIAGLDLDTTEALNDFWFGVVPKAAQAVADRLGRNPALMKGATDLSVIDAIIGNLVTGYTSHTTALGETFDFAAELDQTRDIESDFDVLNLNIAADQKLQRYLGATGLSEFDLTLPERETIRAASPGRLDQMIRDKRAEKDVRQRRDRTLSFIGEDEFSVTPERLAEIEGMTAEEQEALIRAFRADLPVLDFLEGLGIGRDSVSDEGFQRLRDLGEEGLRQQLETQTNRAAFPTFGGLDIDSDIPLPGEQFVPRNPFDVEDVEIGRADQLALEAAGGDPILEQFLIREGRRIEAEFPERAARAQAEEIRGLEEEARTRAEAGGFDGFAALNAARTQASNVRPPAFEDIFEQDITAARSRIEERPDVIRAQREREEQERKERLRRPRTFVN
jgi:hypothetical protein